MNTLSDLHNADHGDVVWLQTLGAGDVSGFGGKNAALGEMLGRLATAGVEVPAGFATSARAFRSFLAQQGVDDWIGSRLERLDRNDASAVAAAGDEIRSRIRALPLPATLESALRTMYRELGRREGREDLPVAVRSSATAEDLPEASFAGQQETYLNVRGIAALLGRVRDVFASLYTDRAIVYRAHHGFRESDVALSAGIQRMVRADIGVSGVMFTLDPDSGFRDVVVIDAAWGLGENVVQGTVDPDEFHVHKPGVRAGRPAILRRGLGSKLQRLVFSGEGDAGLRNEDVPAPLQQRFCLSDDEVHALARHALAIEAHFGRPMDIEWARDGESGRLLILQARPETVRAREDALQLETYRLTGKGELLCRGHAVGRRIGAGPARRVEGERDLSSVQRGDVLVARSTNPDWEPVMSRVAAIVTDHGGRTCHAAIVARELGIPAVVGCGDATQRIANGAEVTVSCAGGEEGLIFAGRVAFEHSTRDLGQLPPLPVKLMLNVGNPEQAYDFARLPHAGVGLARLEFMVAQRIGIHPRAALDFATLPADEQAAIAALSQGYPDPVTFYVERLSEGIATLAAAFAPHPVIVRLSDFKSNEYRNLAGGSHYEPLEENPMIGLRGAARYVDPAFAACFALECRALRHVREDMGLDNVWVMVPFVRTLAEARAVVDALAGQGLRRGEHGLKLVMMCEVPSNALSADAFLDLFDGFSIGSNDLTQLTLGVDRDSETVTGSFDERDPAVKALMAMAINACRERGKYIGICGQGPSDHPDLAQWLIAQGIESMSLNPDSLLSTWLHLAGHAPGTEPREHRPKLAASAILPYGMIEGQEDRDNTLTLLSDVFDALPVAIVIANARRDIVMINREAESLLGHRRDKLVGQSVEVLVPEALREAHAQHYLDYQNAPASRRMGANRDLSVQRADGSLLPVEIALKPLNGANGPLVIAAIVDISARKAIERQANDVHVELERRVLERTEQLERSNREKLEMVKGLEQARAELERLSRQDPLTGLANRREFSERVALELQRSRRLGSPVSFAMLDIDRFKRINDRHGHALGDEVLRRLADIFRHQSRAADVVARHGGEEFTLALPDTGLDEAMTLCERIRVAVETCNWEELRSDLRVTISIGVVTIRDGESADSAVARADALMYEAKRRGRNRVESIAPAM